MSDGTTVYVYPGLAGGFQWRLQGGGVWFRLSEAHEWLICVPFENPEVEEKAWLEEFVVSGKLIPL